MKIKLIILTCLLFGITATHTVDAQTKTPEITQRQIRQQKRIGLGIESSELTYRETKNLQQQQKRINQGKKNAKADGVVTPQERVVIHTRQHAANKNIRRKKNNKRDRNT